MTYISRFKSIDRTWFYVMFMNYLEINILRSAIRITLLQVYDVVTNYMGGTYRVLVVCKSRSLGRPNVGH